MTPSWLKKNATFDDVEIGGNELQLTIGTDNRRYENIFKVPLLTSGCVPNGEDLTVRMHVGIELPEPPAPVRPPPRAPFRPRPRPRDPIV